MTDTTGQLAPQVLSRNNCKGLGISGFAIEPGLLSFEQSFLVGGRGRPWLLGKVLLPTRPLRPRRAGLGYALDEVRWLHV